MLDNQPVSWKARLTNQISPETQEALSKSKAKAALRANDLQGQVTQLHSAQVTPSLAQSFNNLQFSNTISRIEHSASLNPLDVSEQWLQQQVQ